MCRGAAARVGGPAGGAAVSRAGRPTRPAVPITAADAARPAGVCARRAVRVVQRAVLLVRSLGRALRQPRAVRAGAAPPGVPAAPAAPCVQAVLPRTPAAQAGGGPPADGPLPTLPPPPGLPPALRPHRGWHHPGAGRLAVPAEPAGGVVPPLVELPGPPALHKLPARFEPGAPDVPVLLCSPRPAPAPPLLSSRRTLRRWSWCRSWCRRGSAASRSRVGAGAGAGMGWAWVGARPREPGPASCGGLAATLRDRPCPALPCPAPPQAASRVRTMWPPAPASTAARWTQPGRPSLPMPPLAPAVAVTAPRQQQQQQQRRRRTRTRTRRRRRPRRGACAWRPPSGPTCSRCLPAARMARTAG